MSDFLGSRNESVQVIRVQPSTFYCDLILYEF
jgi:hypothetical protein